MLWSTRIDPSFPGGQFIIPGNKQPYLRKRDFHDRGVIVNIRKDTPSKKTNSSKLDGDIKGQIFELNLRKLKLLMFEA